MYSEIALYEKRIKNPKLLQNVVDFKMKFYPRVWAKYEEVKNGRIKLVPPDYNLDALRSDYKSMESMIFGDYPNFDELMQFIKEFELNLNAAIMI